MITAELNKIQQIIINTTENILPDEKLQAFINSGSKYIRSKIAVLYLKAFNKEISNDIPKIIAAGELIHNASLLHDDVIDDSDLRRGKTTIAKEFSQNISILSGDYIITNAVNLLLSINNNEIASMFTECVKTMAKAEINQYFMRDKIPSKDEYLKICEGKTAELFATILTCCSLISDLDLDFGRDFGKIFGLYFQIKNDMEYHSSNEDKKNKINTAINILGIENTTILLDNLKAELDNLLGNMPRNQYSVELRNIINKL